jgi:hypothetical protein
MKSSKFFAAALIIATGVFASNSAFATTPSSTTTEDKKSCECATSTSLIKYGDNMVTSVATGKGSAATFAAVSYEPYGTSTAQTGGVATSDSKNPIKTTNGPVYSEVN